MKNKLYIFMAFLAMVSAAGCSSDDPLFTTAEPETGASITNSGKRSLTEALGISAASRRATRSSDSIVESVDYVVHQGDTVAYIVNYANDGGFAILAADRVVKPILAYSDHGEFSKDNEMAMNYFVANIRNYAQEVKRASSKRMSRTENMDTIPYIHEPVIKIKLGQGSPYDAVVMKYYPGYPVGCGPVAGFTLMAYCKDSLVLDHRYYDFKFITKILPEGRDTLIKPIIIDLPIANPTNLTPSTSVISWPYTYTGALNATQTLLYKLGEKMNVSHKNSETSCFIDDARLALQELEYVVSDLKGYNPKEMVMDICENNRMYFQSGQSLRNPNKGHFWVIDGCKYGLVANSTSIMDTVDTELYCHWGWYGHCDGYYTGEVFSPDPDPDPATRLEYRVSSNFYVQSEIEYDNE